MELGLRVSGTAGIFSAGLEVEINMGWRSCSWPTSPEIVELNSEESSTVPCNGL